MKDFMKTNCYEATNTMIIVGSCLKDMAPNSYGILEGISPNIFEVCLENTHLNMVITKLMGMLSRVDIKEIIFATVDNSPHCIQLHYIENEIRKAMNTEIDMIHYVTVNDELIEIAPETIDRSRSLCMLQSESVDI